MVETSVEMKKISSYENKDKLRLRSSLNRSNGIALNIALSLMERHVITDGAANHCFKANLAFLTFSQSSNVGCFTILKWRIIFHSKVTFQAFNFLLLSTFEMQFYR